MATRKIWIKRPNGSPTLIYAADGDVVDEARAMILQKYANTLGRTYDSPDISLRLIARARPPKERLLRPEECICAVLDMFFPGGQGVEEALLIEVPDDVKPSLSTHDRWSENLIVDDDVNPKPIGTSRDGPGPSRRANLHRSCDGPERPGPSRSGSPQNNVNSGLKHTLPAQAPTQPPIPQRRSSLTRQSHASRNPDTAIPPINILIVEDNPISRALLEQFAKRQKLRYSSAVDGREALTKWRAGGFHLVLMDLQLPIMSGLDATREIRRLERINGIGVFGKADGNAEDDKGMANKLAGDELQRRELFKSPVIILALTAGTLPSDRDDALAAGCNDFLIKPVKFTWLERKMREWGSMQALVDVEGWRIWNSTSEDPTTSTLSMKLSHAT